MVEALSLEQANQLLSEMRTRQSDLEMQNQELKRELERLRDQKLEGTLPEKSLFETGGRRKPAGSNITPNKGLLRCIIDTIGDLIYVKDANGVYRGCNKASENFVGLKEAEQIGKTDFDFFNQDLAEAILNTDKQIMTSRQKHSSEEWVTSRDGRNVLLETQKAPFYGPDGEVAGIVGISRDITERKISETLLKESNEELDAFVKTVAHDLRSPITPIIGYAEMLRENYKDQLDEQGLSYLSGIENAGAEMLSLMESLLSLARAGTLKRPVERVSTDEVVARVIKNLGANISSAGVVFQIDPLPSVHVPKTYLTQIFDNLISNAIRYAGKSGGLIEVGGEQAGKQIRFFVRDHGSGISEQERKHVFEIFYRGTNKGKVKGSGIGLAIVYKIARNCGGRAWVEKTHGGGCTFWVEMEDASQP